MSQFTVLLMYDVSCWSSSDSPETFLARVEALDPVDAAIKAHEDMASEVGEDLSKDAITLLVVSGWHYDLTGVEVAG